MFIVGRTMVYPEWVYSRQSDWYERATGYRIAYSAEKGLAVYQQRSWRDIKIKGKGKAPKTDDNPH